MVKSLISQLLDTSWYFQKHLEFDPSSLIVIVELSKK